MEEIAEQRLIIDIDLAPNVDAVYTGKCIVANSEIVMLLNFDEENEKFDGYTIVKNSDVEKYRTWQEEDYTDKNNKKYDIHQVVQGMKITTTTENYKMTLKAGKTRSFMAKFWPLFPNDEKIERMEVNGKPILLKEI